MVVQKEVATRRLARNYATPTRGRCKIPAARAESGEQKAGSGVREAESRVRGAGSRKGWNHRMIHRPAGNPKRKRGLHRDLPSLTHRVYCAAVCRQTTGTVNNPPTAAGAEIADEKWRSAGVQKEFGTRLLDRRGAGSGEPERMETEATEISHSVASALSYSIDWLPFPNAQTRRLFLSRSQWITRSLPFLAQLSSVHRACRSTARGESFITSYQTLTRVPSSNCTVDG